MKSNILCLAMAAAMLCLGCVKSKDSTLPLASSSTSLSGFTQYIIRSGSNYCDQSAYKPVATTEMKFQVLFDSSAIYQTTKPENQYDINKLYGFSDNGMDHHQFSARFGWRWSDGALRLFAYVYNKGSWSEKEIGTVPIGAIISCSIKVNSDTYVFTMNDTTVTMPRMSTTPQAQGYQLYPYFGGDEAAPHEVRVWIRER
jgi:hypothetical protein